MLPSPALSGTIKISNSTDSRPPKLPFHTPAADLAMAGKGLLITGPVNGQAPFRENLRGQVRGKTAIRVQTEDGLTGNNAAFVGPQLLQQLQSGGQRAIKLALLVLDNLHKPGCILSLLRSKQKAMRLQEWFYQPREQWTIEVEQTALARSSTEQAAH